MTDKTPQSEIADTVAKLATINASRTLCHKFFTKQIDDMFDLMVDAITKEPETKPVLEELAKKLQAGLINKKQLDTKDVS